MSIPEYIDLFTGKPVKKQINSPFRGMSGKSARVADLSMSL